jgi:uncharacterized membrane-anchored protein
MMLRQTEGQPSHLDGLTVRRFDHYYIFRKRRNGTDPSTALCRVPLGERARKFLEFVPFLNRS